MNTDCTNTKRDVYCCYLLRCLKPKWNNSQYIGFTNNPPRRIRQHNGELKNGAKQTRKKRPWEMVLFIYGFPTKHSALQFEWAWQKPKYSRLVKHHLSKKSYKAGVNGKIQILLEMIQMLPFKNYALSINWTNYRNYQQYQSLINDDNIPKYINIYIRPLNKLFYFHKKPKNDVVIFSKNNQNGDLLDKYQKDIKYCHPSIIYTHCCQKKEELHHLRGLNQSSLLLQFDNKFTKCPNKKCNAYLHLLCLSKSALKQNMESFKNKCKDNNDKSNNLGISNQVRIIPNNVQCPKCKNIELWPDYIRNTLRFVDITIESDVEEEDDDDFDDDDLSEDEFEEQFDDGLHSIDIDDQYNYDNSMDIDQSLEKEVNDCMENENGIECESDEDDDIGMSLRDRLRKRGLMK